MELWNVDDIIPYEKNPRRNDDAVKFVANSIREFGFNDPIVINGEGVVLAGHTRLKAAKSLGMKQVPVYVRTDMTPEQEKAFRIADNKASEKAYWDDFLLKDELNDLGDAFQMTDFGFEDWELGMDEKLFADPEEDIEKNMKSLK